MDVTSRESKLLRSLQWMTRDVVRYSVSCEFLLF